METIGKPDLETNETLTPKALHLQTRTLQPESLNAWPTSCQNLKA